MKRIARWTLAVVVAATAGVWYPATSAGNVAHAISSCPTDQLSSLTPYTTDYSADSNAVNVGVKFKVNGAPYVQGVKFYKGSGNTGTHIAHLYDVTTSTDLASEEYTSETSSGWQSVDFDSSVAVNSAHDYTVWVSMPNGNYAVDGGPGGSNTFDDHGQFGANDDVVYLPGGNSTGTWEYTSDDTTVPTHSTGNNYWVSPVVGDVITPTNPSSLSGTAATAGHTISWSTAGRDTNAATSSGNIVKYKVQRSQGEIFNYVGDFPGDSTSLIDPTAAGDGWFYQVKVVDACGNTSAYSGGTSGGSESVPSQSHVFSSNPSTTDTGQTDPVTVGTRWNTATAGNVWGVRYYRASNTVPTSGNFKVGLWDNDGTLLASRDVPAGNNQSGWVDVRFSSPVSVDANNDYVVGYYTPNGQEVYTGSRITSDVTNGDLTAPGDSMGTPNGVYSTNSSFAFPNTRSNDANWYGVDVDFYVP
jgi:Domain of unknown function (DUF4082)